MNTEKNPSHTRRRYAAHHNHVAGALRDAALTSTRLVTAIDIEAAL
jgi:hypothetical protein